MRNNTFSASACPQLALPKKGRVKLTGAAYKRVVRQVYELDGWQCKACRRRSMLTPHHMTKRSKLRLDTVENILTLCAPCNQAEKDGWLLVEWIDQSARTVNVIPIAASQRKTPLPRPLAITAKNEARGVEKAAPVLGPNT